MASMGRHLCVSSPQKHLKEGETRDVFNGKRPVSRRRLGAVSCEFGRTGSLHRIMRITSNRLQSTRICSSMSDAITSIEKTEKRVQVSDVIDWFINLPWPKMASWIIVIGVASQLKEFLGVCVF